MQKGLSISDLGEGNYVTLIDEKRQYASNGIIGPPGQIPNLLPSC